MNKLIIKHRLIQSLPLVLLAVLLVVTGCSKSVPSSQGGNTSADKQQVSLLTEKGKSG
ncbi:hypothetical protein [Paenibacillus sanguinis]|uniref:hypothetical protein n=1 Tax=Paenibacillus sanguinis TaxID=225906 RepID=UPI0003729315|nr:hypothetical protein [Paenibacillus sanguinis]